MDELKPCPFCGSIANFVHMHYPDANGKRGGAYCNNASCALHEPFYVDEWNNRPLEDALRAKLDIAVKLFVLIDDAITDDLMENGMPINKQWEEIYRKVIDAKMKLGGKS